MKKLLLVCGFIITSCVFLMAQDIDALIKNAVEGLALRVTSPIEASIGGIYLEGTVTPSGLSRYLANRIKAHAPDTGKFNLLPLSHGNITVKPGDPQKGVLNGSFRQTGGMVHITLQLVGDPGGQVIESRNFSIPESFLKENGIDVLPANVRTLEEIIEQERIFAPPTSQQSSSALQIEVWPDSDTGTYFAGDKMTINLLANRDGYARVDYIDADGNLQLVFPNIYNRDNSIRANQVQVLPKFPVELTLDNSLGTERVWVRVSAEPFNISESDFTALKTATRDSVAASRAASGRAGNTVEAFFSITKLHDTFYDETYSYQPDSIAEAIEDIRIDVLQQQGGNFPGDARDREGAFSTSEIIGVYRVTEDIVTVNLRYTSNQLFASATRGSTKEHKFDFNKPDNMTLAYESAKKAAEGSGGELIGNEEGGNFYAFAQGKGVLKGIKARIAGGYKVSDKVYITITDKPSIPGLNNTINKAIEEEVESFFFPREVFP